MDFERISAGQMVLVRIPPSRAKDIHNQSREPLWCHNLGWLEQPDLDDITEEMKNQGLMLWDVQPTTGGKSLGLAALVNHSGPSYLFVRAFGQEFALNDFEEICLNLAHAFFKTSQENELWFYAPLPTPPPLYELLTRLGFDSWEGVVPHETENIVYIMERETYQSYYGNDAAE